MGRDEIYSESGRLKTGLLETKDPNKRTRHDKTRKNGTKKKKSSHWFRRFIGDVEERE